MSPRSIAELAAALEAQDEPAFSPATALTIHERAARLDEMADRSLPEMVPQPGPIHLALAECLDDLLTMLVGATREELPAQFRAVIRALHFAKGMVAEAIARTPEDEVIAKMIFIRDLLNKQLFGRMNIPGSNGTDSTDGALPRSDQPPQG